MYIADNNTQEGSLTEHHNEQDVIVTLDNMRIVLVSNLVNAIEKLKESGYWIVGTALENSI